MTVEVDVDGAMKEQLVPLKDEYLVRLEEISKPLKPLAPSQEAAAPNP